MTDQTAKKDEGKLRLTLCPTQIIKDITEVRMFGTAKYGDPDNWREVEPERFRDALLRHLIEYIKDPRSVDPESGLLHRKHAACNLAFLSEMEGDEDE